MLLAVTIAVLLLVAEAILAVRYRRRHGKSVYQRPNMARHAPSNDPDIDHMDDARPSIIAHPYFGYCVHPGLPVGNFLGGRAAGMLAPGGDGAWLAVKPNSFGLWNRHGDGPWHDGTDSGCITVVNLGGSVSNWFSMIGGPHFERLLAEKLGRPVKLHNFALGGMKQPQQTGVLQHILNIYDKIDFVINIDGYNELVFGQYNVDRHIDITLPSEHMMTPIRQFMEARTLTADQVGILHGMIRDKRYRARLLSWREWMRSGILATANDALIAELERKQGRDSATFRNAGQTEQSPLVWNAPPFGSQGAAMCWQRGSVELQRLCQSHGIQYLHALPPTHHFGNKPMTPREIAWQEEGVAQARLIQEGYPDLISLGEELKTLGINFVNFAGLFDHITDETYCDFAGHLNQHGNDLLAQAIVDALPIKTP